MADVNWQEQWDLFHRALEIPAADRRQFVKAEAEGDVDLARAVLELLQAHDETNPVLNEPVISAAGLLSDLDAEGLIGESIDSYVIRSVIGEGGMGVVYEAEQTEPVKRRVALKLIKLGMNTREVVSRFQQERQALAVMNHPNIAKVYDAGATTDGRPYFAMEIVEGHAVTDYCDAERLDNRQRLEICAEILTGIHHAHQKGVIHRDIKPSNVLVHSDDDGNAVVKIIDFGIAKATDQRATEKTLFTAVGRLVGTPAYMSPEQAAITDAGIDIRTDIYSCSVLLYELLTGCVPFENESLMSAGFAEMQRIICEQDPQPPSHKLETLDDQRLTDAAAHRRVTNRHLGREVRGDLDWIVMKGLEKEPGRRYDSAAEFAADIRRYLDDQPVSARPPGAGYRLGKFIRRHRWGVSAATVAAAGIGVFSVSTAWQSARLSAALEETRLEQQKAQRVTDFLIALLAESDPNNSMGENVTVKQALDKGASRLTTELEDEPATKAAILIQMAEIYRELGDYDNAELLLERASGALTPIADMHAESVASLKQVRANLYHDKGEYDEAETHYRASIEAFRQLDAGHSGLVPVMKDLGDLLRDKGDYAQSVAQLEEAVALAREVLTSGDSNLALSIGTLAYARHQNGDSAGAGPLFEESIALWRDADGNHQLQLAYVLSTYGIFLRQQGKSEEAIDAQLEIVEIYRKVLGEEHPYFATSLNNLASAYQQGGYIDKAEATALQSVAAHDTAYEGNHPNKATAYYQLAVTQSSLGRYAEAEKMFRQTLEVDKVNLGEKHPFVLGDLEQISVTLKHQGRLEQAEDLQRQTLEGRTEVLGADHPDTASAHLNLSGILALQGNVDGAVSHSELAVSILAGEAETSLRRVAARASLAAAYFDAERYEEAEVIWAELVELHRRTLPADHPSLAHALHGLGVAWISLDKPAVEVLDEALMIREAKFGPDHPNTEITRDALERASQRQTSPD